MFFWNSLALSMVQSVQFSSVSQSCPTLCDLMDCSTPGLPVHHQLMVQWMLAIWSLFPLPFLNPAYIYGNSWFTYCWSLAWRILSITLLAYETSEIVTLLEHSLALPFFGIGVKTDFSSPVVTAEFSKCADILSATLSQHHLWGFEIAQLEFHHLH